MTNRMPAYGSNAAFKMETPAFIRLAGTTVTKPADIATAETLFYGVKGTAVLTIVTTTAASEYFTYDTPQQKYGFYYEVATTGVEPVVADVDVWHKIVLPTAFTVAQAKAKIIEALEDVKDVKVVSGTGTNIAEITITNKQGGVCEAFVDGDSGVTATNTPGTGEWALIGKLAADMDAPAEPNLVPDSEGGDIRLSTKRTVNFSLMNVNQKTLEIIESQWDREKVDVAFMDITNDLNPIVIYHGMTLNFDFSPMGEVATIDFTLSRSARDESKFRKFYTYE